MTGAFCHHSSWVQELFLDTLAFSMIAKIMIQITIAVIANPAIMS